jgi:hypothetical protein
MAEQAVAEGEFYSFLLITTIYRITHKATEDEFRGLFVVSVFTAEAARKFSHSRENVNPDLSGNSGCMRSVFSREQVYPRGSGERHEACHCIFHRVHRWSAIL